MRLAGLMGLAGLLLGVCGETAAAAPMQEEVEVPTFTKARAIATAALIDDIEAYAEWCGDSKLYAQRDRAWEVVLSLAPDHKEAHKALGHKLDKRTGIWKPNPKRKPPQDRNKKKAEEAPERWAKVIASYRDATLVLVDQRADTLSDAQRERALDDLLELNPDDEVVRARRGEVRLGEAWVLQETAAGKRSRPAMKAVVAKAFAAAPEPGLIEPDVFEAALGVAWTRTVATDCVRVLTTGDDEEARRAGKAAHAAGDLFLATCGAAPVYPKALRYVLLANEGEKEALLGAHPNVDDASRRYIDPLVGTVLPGSEDFCWWSETPAHRLDGVMRASFSWFLQEAYDVGPQYGWLHEGLGLYLTRTLVGTRLNWFALPSEYSSTAENAAFLAKLYDTSVNWMNEAYQMLQRERRPRFARFMKKDLRALTSEELLYSYVLAAYLLEGRPEETPEFLKRVGAGDDQARVCVEVLGLDVEELDARVLTWLSQRR